MGRPRKTASGVGARLESIIPQGDNVGEFAKELGVSDRTLGNYLRGEREPSYDFLVRLRKKTGVDINWVISGEGGSASPQKSLAASVSIPRYEVAASAGGGAVVLSQDVEDYFVVSRDWLSRIARPNAKLGILEARGDSMSPTLTDGDILVVNFDIDRNTVAEGGVFVLSFDGMLVVKRLQVTLDGAVLVISDNERYQTERLDREYADEKMTIHAKVIWAGGALR